MSSPMLLSFRSVIVPARSPRVSVQATWSVAAILGSMVAPDPKESARASVAWALPVSSRLALPLGCGLNANVTLKLGTAAPLGTVAVAESRLLSVPDAAKPGSFASRLSVMGEPDDESSAAKPPVWTVKFRR